MVFAGTQFSWEGKNVEIKEEENGNIVAEGEDTVAEGADMGMNSRENGARVGEVRVEPGGVRGEADESY